MKRNTRKAGLSFQCHRGQEKQVAKYILRAQLLHKESDGLGER